MRPTERERGERCTALVCTRTAKSAHAITPSHHCTMRPLAHLNAWHVRRAGFRSPSAGLRSFFRAGARSEHADAGDVGRHRGPGGCIPPRPCTTSPHALAPVHTCVVLEGPGAKPHTSPCPVATLDGQLVGAAFSGGGGSFPEMWVLIFGGGSCTGGSNSSSNYAITGRTCTHPCV